MNTYIIGDIQGCFDSLQALLTKIQYDPAKDRLCFVGDLVNRGPKSLETLRFVTQLKKPLITLGNHDLHLMALYFGTGDKKQSPALHDTLNAPDCDALISFLLQQPLLFANEDFVMVHAGIPPQWSMHEALAYAHEAECALQKNPAAFFSTMYGNESTQWKNSLSGAHRIRYIVNALTRIRFCTRNGELDLLNTTESTSNTAFRPWFEWTSFQRDRYFGHWASLVGRCTTPRVFALDTGCVWGNRLTAIRAEDHNLLSVSAVEI